MTSVTRDDIWLFIFEQSGVRTKELDTEFVKTRRISRGTMYKYKQQLELEGKILVKPIQSKPPYNIYYVPQKYHKVLTALQQYKSLSSISSGTINDVEWQDVTDDPRFTNVKMSRLWQNDRGVKVSLCKVSPGLTIPHIHTVNHFYFGLSDEIETPDGKRMSVQGRFAFQPKGVADTRARVVRVVKECLFLIFSDGSGNTIVVDEQ